MIAASYISAISWFQPPPIGVLRIKRYIHTALKLGLVSIPIGVLRMQGSISDVLQKGSFNPHWGSSNPFFQIQNRYLAGFNPHWGSSNQERDDADFAGWGFQSPLGFFELQVLLACLGDRGVSIPIGVLRIPKN